MKDNLINRTMTPPENPADNSYEETERIIDLLEWVKATFKPNQIFTDFELGQWAILNGYIKIDNNKDY